MFPYSPGREVGDDDPVYPAVCTALAKGFETIMEDGVEVSHQYQGGFPRLAGCLSVFEEAVQAHAVSQAFVAASWMTGPSAIGSLKGMPISNMSMPRAASVRMMSAVLPAVGCPAQKYRERMFCFFSFE